MDALSSHFLQMDLGQHQILGLLVYNLLGYPISHFPRGKPGKYCLGVYKLDGTGFSQNSSQLLHHVTLFLQTKPLVFRKKEE